MAGHAEVLVSALWRLRNMFWGDARSLWNEIEAAAAHMLHIFGQYLSASLRFGVINWNVLLTVSPSNP